MTSVRKNGATAPQRPAGPRGPQCNAPGCGKPIVHVPGKVPKSYCSDACRKRTKRQIAKNLEATHEGATARLGEPTPDTGFSTTGRKVSTPGQRGCETETDPKRTLPNGGDRDGRFDRRESHQTVAEGKTFLACGTRLTGGAAALLLGDKSASFTGACTCGSVHMCVWCAAKILGVRATNAQTMADALAAAGYGLYLGTNTLRHFERQWYGSLRRGERGGLIAVAHDGWSGAFAKAGRPWRRLAAEFGIVGYERAFEDTWGADTGFHIHWHVLWVTERPLSDEEFRRFRRRLAETWRDAVLNAGGYEVSMKCDRPGCSCEGEGHGSDLRPLNTGEEGDAARYLYKDGDKEGKGAAGFGLEFTRSDLKDGRRWGRMSPFQLGDLAAEELAELGQPGPLVAKYREREHGVHGVKKHRRTPGLNKILKALEVAQDERTDDEIAADEDEERKLIAIIPAATWYRHIVRKRGRRLALLRVAESIGEAGVRTLIESWGLVWGTDVLPAETTQA